MITAYHRPQTLAQAIQLISRASPRTLPLGGGTVLSSYRGAPIEVVDLQALGLDRIAQRGKSLRVGAMVTLQTLLEATECPRALAAALRLEATLNLRNAASVAGTLVGGDGRSTFAAVLLALDARLRISSPTAETQRLGDFLALRDHLPRGFLISEVEIPLATALEFDYVARTPADKPIVAVALARWPSGRARLAVAGIGQMPLLAMDGPVASDIEAAARNALHDADDPWGSAEYRMDVAATLSRRCLERLSSQMFSGSD